MTVAATYDVAILGSGFAGSLLATLLARQGMSVILIDSHKHPRFTIGESATPMADLVLKDLAARYQIPELHPLTTYGSWKQNYPQLRCGCKRGFSYFWHGEEGGFQSGPDHPHELLVAASVSRELADTHWYRADVDLFFLKLAFTCGVSISEDTPVQDIVHRGANDWLVRVSHQRNNREIHARFLVDATGPAGVLMRQTGAENLSDTLQTTSSALYGHFQGVGRVADWLEDRGGNLEDHPYPCDDAAVHHLFRDGWMWQLPFDGSLTSVGFVMNSAERICPEIDSDTDAWQVMLKEHSPLDEFLKDARLAEFPGKLFRTGRLQRLFSRAAGEDWAALPFTVGFIDPLHSTGIAHSLLAIEQLADRLVESSPQFRREALEDYSGQVITELRHIDRLIAGSYAGLRLNFDLFISWTMIYFAAATTHEQRRISTRESGQGFLCALDSEFHRLVTELLAELKSLEPASHKASDIDRFRDRVKDALGPYNHAGLFSPRIPHMYDRTSAEKTSCEPH